MDDARVDELLRRHVLEPDDSVLPAPASEGRYRLAETSSGRSYQVRDSDGFRITAEPWVAALWEVEPDVHVQGGRFTLGILLLADGGDVDLSDPDAVAALGRRLLDPGRPLDPVAYAEILVEWQPWQAAPRFVLDRADRLRTVDGLDDAPLVEPPTLTRRPDGTAEVTFGSVLFHSERYGRGGVTVYRWTVQVPADGPVRWNRRAVDDLERA